MSVFSSFFRNAVPLPRWAALGTSRGLTRRGSGNRIHSQPPAVHASLDRGEQRKAKRHGRRDQLYQAVRESMTLSGALSTTYKFKVLSLDQVGERFLVMLDVEKAFANQGDRLGDVETRVVQTARTRYEIEVTAVYWRIAGSGSMRSAKVSPDHNVDVSAGQHPSPAGTKKPLPRYDPIQADEVTVFDRALALAGATRTVCAEATLKKTHHRLPSYALLTGFEDTEMTGLGISPVLSTTQYGELE